jgi:hypothetical protein
MKKGIERDKKTLAKIAKALYQMIQERNIPINDLKNLDFNDSDWMSLLDNLSDVLDIDYYDLDEVSFYTLLVLENIPLIKTNELNEESIYIPELQEFSFDVTTTTSEVWERTYTHTFKAYDYRHAKKALKFDVDAGNTTPWDGKLTYEDIIETEITDYYKFE